jgi:hypothetical protein
MVTSTNTNFSGATLNGGDSIEIIKDSVLGLVRGHDQVEITVRNSVIQGDVIAMGNSIITLIDSVGNVFVVDSGRVILIHSEVQGELSIEDSGSPELRPTLSMTSVRAKHASPLRQTTR